MMAVEKQTLYRGKPVPFDLLSSDEFENFVYAAMLKVGPLHGFMPLLGPQNSSDHGFDITGERVADKAIVCIQCKRLISNFSLTALGTELAKVGLRTRLFGNHPKEHYFMLSGSVTKKLSTALRETSHKTLLSHALAALEDESLAALIKELTDKSMDPKSSVESYVAQLEKIAAWSGRDFDQQIGVVWSQLSDIIEKTFQIESVLREEPRPDFNLNKHLNQLADNKQHIISLTATPTDFPYNISRFPEKDPTANLKSIKLPAQSEEKKAYRTTNMYVENLNPGWIEIICGSGGSGKSSVLQGIAADCAQRYLGGETLPIPIFIRLNHFNRNLNSLIQQTLNITRGNWRSLTTHFVLLCDGLDEVPEGRAQEFLDQLESILEDTTNSAIITLREAGLRSPVSCSKFSFVWGLHRLSYRQAIEMAEMTLDKSNLEKFLPLLRNRISDFEGDILLRPFGVSAAISSFKGSGNIPESFQELINEQFQRRFKVNQGRTSASGQTLPKVVFSTFRRLAEEIAFKLRVEHQQSSLSEEQGLKLIAQALENLKREKVFGADSLTDEGVLALTQHYELLHFSTHGTMWGSHDIIMDSLAGPRLAKSWHSHLGHLKSTLAQDVWVYAAPHVPDEELKDYLTTICNEDLILGARCARRTEKGGLQIVEQIAIGKNLPHSRYSSSVASTAMAILKTPTCIQTLHNQRHDLDPDRQYFATRGLAQAGDIPTLQLILDDIEPLVSSPVKVWGGNHDFWESAPAHATLTLARQRLKANIAGAARPMVASLRTIQKYGDLSDLATLKSLDLFVDEMHFRAGVICMSSISKESAINFLKEKQKSEPKSHQLEILTMLTALGENIDTAEVLSQLVSIREQTFANSRYTELLDLVNKNPLPPQATEFLLRVYSIGNLFQKSNIWQIANKHQLSEFESLALKVLTDKNNEEVGYAINFANTLLVDSPRSNGPFIQAAQNCVEEIMKDPTKHSWHLVRLFEFLNAMGEETFVAKNLELIFTNYLPDNFAESAKKRRDRRNISPGMEVEFLDISIPTLLRVARDLGKLLSRETLKRILFVDLTIGSEESRKAYADLAGLCSPDDLDAALLTVDDPFRRLQILGYIAKYGPTPVRSEAFQKDLPKMLGFALLGEAIKKILSSYWSDEVAKSLVKTVTEHQWKNEVDLSALHDIESSLVRLTDKNQAENIIKPALAQCTNNIVRDMLTVVYEAAAARRER